jgi:hypothetical protein
LYIEQYYSTHELMLASAQTVQLAGAVKPATAAAAAIAAALIVASTDIVYVIRRFFKMHHHAALETQSYASAKALSTRIGTALSVALSSRSHTQALHTVIVGCKSQSMHTRSFSNAKDIIDTNALMLLLSALYALRIWCLFVCLSDHTCTYVPIYVANVLLNVHFFLDHAHTACCILYTHEPII